MSNSDLFLSVPIDRDNIDNINNIRSLKINYLKYIIAGCLEEIAV